MTRVRVLYTAAALIAVPALVLRAIPASAPKVDARPLEVSLGPSRTVPDGPSVRTYDTIAEADPFSSRRTPPAVRFVPAGGEHRVISGAHPSGPKLYGITLGPEGALAVISADPGARRAEVYGIGDTVAAARVVAISESTVTLAKPTGLFTLHLEFAGRRAQ
jgi:hypothetical protein